MAASEPEERILIIAPLGQDAPAMADVLEKKGFRTAMCDGVAHACQEMAKEASALLMTEEALELPQVPRLLDWLKTQPPWAELPVIILTSGGESRFSRLLDLTAAAAGSVTILERPLGSATLVRSVEVALRSRRRQYRVRDLLEEQAGKQRELNALKDHLAADLDAMSRLHHVAARGIQPDGRFKEVLQEIVEAAATITGTTKGTLQLRDVASGILKLTAHFGFEKPFLDFFDIVRLDDPAPCGQAMQKGERIIIEDVTECRSMVGTRALEVELRAGVRAVQSTPLRSRSGELLGMISTHFSEPHHPSAQELRFVDLLARQAADLIERQQAERAVREGERRYRTLFSSIDEGFCVIEMIFNQNGEAKDYRFLEVNPAFERLTGLTGAVGKRMRELVPQHEEEWFQIYGRVALTGRPVRFQNRADSLHRWYDVYAFRVGRAESRRMAVLFTDITARKEAQEMNARLAAIVESSDDAIISKDLSGIILSWNHGAERLFGYKPEEAIGQPITILIPPDHLDDEPKILGRIRRGEPVEHYETVRRRKDGSVLDISLTVSPIKDGTGKVIGASKVARDITADRRAEEAQSRLAAIVEWSEDAIVSKDLNGIIMSWNRGAERLFGYTAEEAVGQSISMVIPKDRLDEETDILRHIRAGEYVEHLETIRRRKDGRLVDISLTVSPVKDASGKIVGASKIARDITETKRAIEASRRAEQELRDFVENASVGMHWVGPDGVILWANQTELDMLGYAREEFVGHNIAEFHANEPVIKEMLERLGRKESLNEYESQMRRKDGSLRNVIINSNVLWEGDKFIHTRCFTRDVTERKAAAEELLKSEERYRALVEQVKDYAIFSMDTEGCPTTWNEGVQRVLGFDEQEFIGQSVVPLIFTPEDVATGTAQRELETAKEKGSAGNDRWMMRKDGTRFFATGVTTGLRNEAGEHIGFTKVLRDETAARRAEESLAEARAKLQEHAANLEKTVAERTQDLHTMNEQLESFVYSIAHDLRTPLRSMSGFSQLLVEEYSSKLDDNAQHLLSRIQASAEFMDKLLMDLLAYGRTARSEMELKPVNLQKAWEAALFQCATQIEHTNAEIETGDLQATVLAHEATLGQCLANLLSNGLKFVAPGVRPRVRCHAEDRGDRTRVWIEDNGLGIPADQHERVFRVFERLHGSRYLGTGIGLSIVRKGVERMGGSVGLESQPGKGSRFWIELRKADEGELTERQK